MRKQNEMIATTTAVGRGACGGISTCVCCGCSARTRPASTNLTCALLQCREKEEEERVVAAVTFERCHDIQGRWEST
jgi:hypothetical protein